MSDAVSEYSSAPITDDQLVAWPRVAAIACMVSFSLPTFITGLEVYQASTPTDTVLAFLIGGLLITIIGSVMGYIGAKARLSSYLLVRIAFGDKGAALVNLAFAISLLGWFGVNIDLFSDAVGRLATDVYGVSVPVWVLEISAGLFMTTTTIFGFKAINTAASWMVPVLVVVTALILWYALSVPLEPALEQAKADATISMGDGVSAIVGAVIIGAIILPDITRFSKHATGGIYTAILAYAVIDIIVMAAAGLGSAATGASDILSIMISLGLGLGAFAIVIASSWILNSLNLYSTVLSVEATFPKLNSKLLTAGLGLVGIGAAFLNLLDIFLTFLFYLSVIFVPVAGVIITDYLWVRRDVYQAKSLENNMGLSMHAFAAWFIGALIALFGSEALIPSFTGTAALDAVIASGALYFIISKVSPPAIPLVDNKENT